MKYQTSWVHLCHSRHLVPCCFGKVFVVLSISIFNFSLFLLISGFSSCRCSAGKSSDIGNSLLAERGVGLCTCFTSCRSHLDRITQSTGIMRSGLSSSCVQTVYGCNVMAIALAHSSSDYQLVHVRMVLVEELFYSTVLLQVLQQKSGKSCLSKSYHWRTPNSRSWLQVLRRSSELDYECYLAMNNDVWLWISISQVGKTHKWNAMCGCIKVTHLELNSSSSRVSLCTPGVLK